MPHVIFISLVSYSYFSWLYYSSICFFFVGSAVGFRLDSLLKLSDTRARNNKTTLMHYLSKVQLYVQYVFSLDKIKIPQES
jgi:hypothetical protein